MSTGNNTAEERRRAVDFVLEARREHGYAVGHVDKHPVLIEVDTTEEGGG